jgi:hypothetical protein
MDQGEYQDRDTHLTGTDELPHIDCLKSMSLNNKMTWAIEAVKMTMIPITWTI